MISNLIKLKSSLILKRSAPSYRIINLVQKNGTRSISYSIPHYKLENVKTPNFPESITEGDLRWSKQVGSFLRTDDTIGEIDTDKTSLPIVAPCDGLLKEILKADGEKVVKGDIVCVIDTDFKPPASEKADTSVSPKTEKKAAVETQKPSPPPKKDDVPVFQSSSEERSETRVPMTRIRNTISLRLKDAQNTCAMLTTFNELDMSTAITIRNKYKDKLLKEHGIKFGFMSTFIKASVHALKMQPIVNSVIINNEIVYRNYIDVSIAVSGSKGLVVPVIRNAHRMSMIEMEKAVADLADKGRKNLLQIEDMEGGTFSITNGGVFGSLFSTPIINMPQSCILGMHAIKDRPVAIDGKVEVRPIMYLALTYDHRLIDGREAVTFLKRIKDSIEDPSFILLGL